MRHQDQQFFDSFMLVIGILMGLAAGLFFLARAVSIDTQGKYVAADPAVIAVVDARIKPVGHVLLLGDAELAAAAAAAVAPPKPSAAPLTGPQVYNAACIACHAPPGLNGAPPLGDVDAWAPRIAQGIDTLHQHALSGFRGERASCRRKAAAWICRTPRSRAPSIIWSSRRRRSNPASSLACGDPRRYFSAASERYTVRAFSTSGAGMTVARILNCA